VQGAGCPSFEQRGDQVRSGHDRVEVTGEVARGGLMSEAVVAESGEHEGAIGVDICAGGDDFTGELSLSSLLCKQGGLGHRYGLIRSG
jgi:hypothetical protein